MCQTRRLCAPSLKRLSGNILLLTLGLWLCSFITVWLYGAFAKRSRTPGNRLGLGAGLRDADRWWLSHPAAACLNSLSFWASFTIRATSAMPLLNLPNELLLKISENLESERDINAIAQANCRLYCLLDSYLYRYNVQQSGSSALLWAARHGQEATARKLLREKANIQATSDDIQRPLWSAVEKGHKQVVKLLIDKGTDVNAQGGDYGNAL